MNAAPVLVARRGIPVVTCGGALNVQERLIWGHSGGADAVGGGDGAVDGVSDGGSSAESRGSAVGVIFIARKMAVTVMSFFVVSSTGCVVFSIVGSTDWRFNGFEKGPFPELERLIGLVGGYRPWDDVTVVYVS